jgi:hypothetical protein
MARSSLTYIPGFSVKFFFQPIHLGWKSGSPDTNFEGGHPGTIPAKFGLNWLSGF